MQMGVIEAKTVLRQLIEYYFTGAIVKYANQSFAVKPYKPLVNISFGSINRPLNPPTEIIDGRPVSFYPTTMMVQIDLFTKGQQVISSMGKTSAMENTAEEDMLSFLSFLNSEYAINYCHENDIAIVIPNTVEDLTGLINDTSYEYRAMAEIELRFTTVAIGYTGTLSPNSVMKEEIKEDMDGTHEMIERPFDWQKDEPDANTKMVPQVAGTPSGGGNNDAVDEEEGYFTNVRVNNKLMKEEK